MSQEEVVAGLGHRGLRWYQALESGARPKLDRPVIDALAQVLLLGRDERAALHLYALDGDLPTIPAPRADDPTRRAVQLLLDRQMPLPAFVTDSVWNIVGFNDAMASWWPWVQQPDANFMRWALLTEEGHTQYVDWHQHAAEYIAMLRLASARHPHDIDLARLIKEVRRAPDCDAIWISSSAMSGSRDGAHHRMVIPALGPDIVEVVSHVLRPGALPDWQLTIVSWAPDNEPGTQPTSPPE
ncbi:helix-turn-helix transcriptional regulator [Streptomyces sp. NPDC002018]|uniref:helix-turn-helix transcriptional regulator n=1 Tax=Streptomyces sp. NPDC002018 TaxID=3364629 RepID=UPI00369BA18A